MPEMTMPRRPSGRRSAKVRPRVFATGALAGLVIALAALVVLSPMTSTRTELRRITSDGVPLQLRLAALRTAVPEWQFYLESKLDAVTPGSAVNPVQLAEGAQLITAQFTQAAALARELRRVGFEAEARDLDAAMSDYKKALTKLTPLAAGGSVEPTALRTLLGGERIAVAAVWKVTTQISQNSSQSITEVATERATERLALGRRLFIAAVGLALLLVLGAASVLGLRAGRQARERHRVSLRHAYEARVQKALQMTKSEGDVYDIVGAALQESLPQLKIELLIADSSRAHFRRAFSNNGDFEGCGVVSPHDCPAATGGQALMFPSSGDLDACPFLKERASGPCSAACIPVSIAGRSVGVTHAVGRDGILPAAEHVETLNFTSRRGAERIAMIRAFETSETQAHTDPLTGLLNRRSLENQVRDLRREGTAYALAYGDLDHFKILNDTHGHETGDQALRAFSRILRDAVRPNDIVARYGGEEFVVVLPDCGTEVAIGVLERVRERLALALSTGHVPQFTVTFGLASTEYATDFDEIVGIADRALLDAKSAGRNRVVVAEVPARTTTDHPHTLDGLRATAAVGNTA